MAPADFDGRLVRTSNTAPGGFLCSPFPPAGVFSCCNAGARRPVLRFLPRPPRTPNSPQWTFAGRRFSSPIAPRAILRPLCR
jgi:hypothetical protein